MKSTKKKRALITICVVIAVVVVGIAVFYAISIHQMSLIPKMTFNDMLTYTTKNNEKAIITVGIIQNGEMNYALYGKDGAALTSDEYVYEIGSLTKTFTASLLYKAISEGKVNLEDPIDKYLNLPAKDYYPTIKRLVTHTSGYKAYYFETQMISNFFNGKNDFYGITKSQLIERIGKVDLKNYDYDFNYSNFGISVIGAILSEIYDDDYTTIINNYVAEELDLDNTIISDGLGDLGNYWDWSDNDAYMPAGALTSTIADMLKYAQLQMKAFPEYIADTHEALTEINATTESNAKMSIHMDSMGAAWIIDNENDIIWHNGGTGDYNCYLGFDLNKQIAVVVLTNLPPNYRIPATVMGVKLLTDLQKESN